MWLSALVLTTCKQERKEKHLCVCWATFLLNLTICVVGNLWSDKGCTNAAAVVAIDTNDSAYISNTYCLQTCNPSYLDRFNVCINDVGRGMTIGAYDVTKLVFYY